MHLEDGLSVEGTRLLSADSARRMRTPTSPSPTGPATGFGLGWRYTERDGKRVLSHGGGSNGGLASAVLAPDDGAACISFVNSSRGMPVHAEIAELFMPPGTSPFVEPATETRSDVDLDSFVGSYRRASQRIDVDRGGEDLIVRLASIVDELEGATVYETGAVTEFAAAPTSETTLLSRGGDPTAFAFSEPVDGRFQLVFWGGRLARRLPR
jgi:hypothetical protein